MVLLGNKGLEIFPRVGIALQPGERGPSDVTLFYRIESCSLDHLRVER